MAENKTQPTDASVDAYLDAAPSDERRRDLRTLAAMMARLTGEAPRMWGPSIVGFGQYRYRYASGREDNAPLAAFSSRKPDLAVYLGCDEPTQPALLPRLGKHRMGKSCLSIRRLADVDLAVLEALVAASIDDARRRHG